MAPPVDVADVQARVLARVLVTNGRNGVLVAGDGTTRREYIRHNGSFTLDDAAVGPCIAASVNKPSNA